jgi:hypothetical protein
MDESDRVVIGDERCRIVLHRPENVVLERIGTTVIEQFEHRIDVVAGAFRGTLNGVVYASGWRHFRDQLVALYESLSGNASLGGYENLKLDMKGDGLGHIAVSVEATDDHVRPIQLSFSIFLDQTQLPTIGTAIEGAFLSSTANS